MNIAFTDTVDNIHWYMVVNYSIDIFFTIDILVNFNSAYTDDSYEIIHDRGKIASNYIQSWFFIDLMSVIPFELIITWT